MAINVRDAVEEDLRAIVQIYNSTVPTRMVTADTEPVSVESRRAWFREHDPASHPLWVVEEDGEIAGWLSFEPFRQRPAYRATVCETEEVVADAGQASSNQTLRIPF